MFGKFFQNIMSKSLLILLMCVAFFIARATMREVERGNRIQQEIASLQTEAQKVQRENGILQEKIRYFQTDEFQSQEAKEKLNYQNPDEKVVVIKPSVQGISSENTAQQQQATVALQDDPNRLLPNYLQWWKQFF